MPAKLEEITAIFLGERIRFDDTLIGEIRLVNGSAEKQPELGDDDNWIPDPGIKVKADPDELQQHQTYRFYGRWSKYTNRRSGFTEDQFHAQTFVRAQPHGREGIISYLRLAGKGHGIGNVRATRLWETFGSDAVRILRETPDAAAAAIKGLSLEKAKEAAEWLDKERALEDCTIELTNLLDRRGLPKAVVRKAIKKWGNQATEVIKRDPYQLMAFRGCGFKRCDQLWLDLGKPPGRLRRQALCAWYAVASNTEGHTWFPVESAIQGIRDQVQGSEIRPVSAIKLAKRIAKLSLDRNGALATLQADPQSGVIVDGGGQLWLAEGRKADQESRLANLVAASETELARWLDVETIEEISDHQRENLSNALRGPIGILGGRPGTGKTYTAARLIAALIEQHGVNQIAVGAPTGKAAVRITEAMQEYGLPLRARTWHSLLGVGQAANESGNWGFLHNANNPFPYKALLGDESSMVDLSLMYSIFCARAVGTLFLLAGDVNQLLPVGHGAPLRDFINAGLPYGELTEIRRNSGGIVEACGNICDGKQWQPGGNLEVIES